MNNNARIKALLGMLAQEPEDEFLNYALGLEYANDSSSYALAEAQFLKVLTNNVNYIAAYYQLGQLYAAMNNKEKALNTLQQGLQAAKLQKNNKAINEINEAIFLLEDDWFVLIAFNSTLLSFNNGIELKADKFPNLRFISGLR